MTKSENCDINIINKRTKKYHSWDKTEPVPNVPVPNVPNVQKRRDEYE